MLIDSGTDILMRGDEAGLGTPGRRYGKPGSGLRNRRQAFHDPRSELFSFELMGAYRRLLYRSKLEQTETTVDTGRGACCRTEESR